MSPQAKPDEPCPGCEHPSGPHYMIATRNDDPKLGGVRLCNVPGCECLASWDVPPYSTREEVVIPDDHTVDELRRQLWERDGGKPPVR